MKYFLWVAFSVLCLLAGLLYGYEIAMMKYDRYIRLARESVEKCHALITTNGIYE